MQNANDIARKALGSASEATRRLNPHLFRDGVRGLPAYVAQPPVAPALDRRGQERQERPDGVVVRVTFIALTARELDDDNLEASLKPLRDAVAAWLGLDDRPGEVEWEYGQARTRGRRGVMVRVDVTA